MKKDSFFKQRIFPVLFMFVITTFYILILTVVYLYTKDRIAFMESLKLKKLLMGAATISIPESENESEFEEIFQRSIKPVLNNNNALIYYEIYNEGILDGYIFIREGAGLWGRIISIVGYETDLETLKGIEFIKQNETPGLGARISEDWFRVQFRGKMGKLEFVSEGSEIAENEFQAITGASITSTAVKEIINSSMEDVKKIVSNSKGI